MPFDRSPRNSTLLGGEGVKRNGKGKSTFGAASDNDSGFGKEIFLLIFQFLY
jgi:hypothetical protein